MKKNDWLLIVAAIVFGILFYKQSPGLNFFLFTGLITCLIAFFNPTNLKNRLWWYYAALTNLCGFSVMTANSDLSIIATLFSLMVFSAKSVNVKNSVIFGLAFSFYSLISSPVYLLLDLRERKKRAPVTDNTVRWRTYGGIVVAVMISILFMALYQQANPLFKNFTSRLDLSWISPGWCLFCIWGFLMIYGLLFYRDVDSLRNWDLTTNRNIQKGSDETENEPFNYTSIVLTLFILLNIMLLTINLLDIDNLYISKQLPDGITLSDFVHNAVAGLVFSIVIAMGLILWFFKGNLNFNRHSRTLKLLVYGWIVQSFLMVVSTMVRNSWYITGYQLTYLRIGVYVFLGLSLVGLVLTFIKVNRNKSAWYLVRQNFEAWILLFALSGTINWDKRISEFNIAHAKNYQRLDKSYLVNLSDAQLAPLSSLMYSNATPESRNDPDYKALSNQLYWFKQKEKELSWQSFNLRDQQTKRGLQTLISEKKISFLNLENAGQIKLEDLRDFYYVRSLSLHTLPSDQYLLCRFKDLEHLKLYNFPADGIQWLLLNKELKQLEIEGWFGDYLHTHYLNYLKKLSLLRVPMIRNEDLEKLNGHPSLKIVKVKNLPQDQIVFIKETKLSFKVEEEGSDAQR